LGRSSKKIMLKKVMEAGLIAELAGLPQEEIEGLRKQLLR